MSKKLKKGTSNAPYSIGGIYERLAELKPSSMAIIVLGLGFGIFLLSGTVFSLTPSSSGPVGYTNHFIWFYPDLSGQYISENIITAALFTIGLGGLFAVYQSSKSAYKPRNAYMLMVIGVTLLIISFIVLEYGLYLKTNHIY